ncbi:MAG TPA: hypothetical protein PLK94_13205 [Alphaproteobacteria bacterium]|nr:hypothetical protein [Alphaproteobacteria bacterium]
MELRDIVLNYLTDNEKGMQELITWFLNDVMKEDIAAGRCIEIRENKYPESTSEWLSAAVA